MASPAIVWFRNDLRLADNPALHEAVKSGRPIIPVFIWAPEDDREWAPGAASRWWLHQSLAGLDASFRRLGSRLVLRSGPASQALHDLVAETRTGAVFWNRLYEPPARERDASLEQSLRNSGLAVRSFNGALLHEPGAVRNSSGKPFQVFSAFWRHCLNLEVPAAPLPVPKSVPSPMSWPKSLRLAELKLEPKPDWASGLRGAWSPGETGATEQLKYFLSERFDGYAVNRNRPDLDGTSGLSPHLHFGEVSARQVFQKIKRTLEGHGGKMDLLDLRDCSFAAELGWREFSHHLLYHFPQTPSRALRADFARFQWRRNPESLRAWQRGLTGYPLVDAGMRELWTTGWMHNRVRMVGCPCVPRDRGRLRIRLTASISCT